MKIVQCILLSVFVIFAAKQTYAEDVTKPYTFTSGTPAYAEEVNANFDVLFNAVNQIGNGLPAGAIIMWSGSIDQIPSGWVLCDGTNGTPDLTDRFIIGAGKSYLAGSAGGSENHSHSGASHQHEITASNLNHYHSISNHTHGFSGTTKKPAYNSTNKDVVRDAPSNDTNTDDVASEIHTHSFNGTTDGAQGNTNWSNDQGFNLNHNHGGMTQTASGGVTSISSNLPPYYALAFIIKL